MTPYNLYEELKKKKERYEFKDDDLIGYAVRVIRCCFCSDFYF